MTDKTHERQTHGQKTHTAYTLNEITTQRTQERKPHTVIQREHDRRPDDVDRYTEQANERVTPRTCEIQKELQKLSNAMQNTAAQPTRRTPGRANYRHNT